MVDDRPGGPARALAGLYTTGSPARAGKRGRPTLGWDEMLRARGLERRDDGYANAKSVCRLRN